MNAVFRRLPLPVKFVLIALVPLVYIVFLATQLYYEKQRNIDLLTSYINRIDQSARITRLIDQLQKERFYSFDFALKENNYPLVLNQRPSTDSLIQVLKLEHDHSLKNFETFTFIDDLDSIRGLIDNGQFASDEVMHYYSSMVFRLNSLNGVPVPNNDYLRDVYGDMVAQKILSEMITYMGIINANVYNALYTRKYMTEILLGSRGAYDIYNSYIEEFEAKASPKAIREFNILMQQPEVKTANNYLDTIFRSYSYGSSYTSVSWGVLSDNAINRMRQLQMKLLDGVEEKINRFYAREKREILYTVLLIWMIFFLLAAILWITINSINRSLRKLKYAALEIADGSNNVKVNINSPDAIGSLAKSIKKIDINGQQLTQAAIQIGLGNFNVPVEPRSEKDLLGHAVMNMKNNLQQFTSDLQESRNAFKQLADFVPQMVWTARPDGTTDYFNEKWYEITGASKKNIGQSWMAAIHPADIGYCLQTWNESVNKGTLYQIEYRIRDAKTNGYRWYLGRALPIVNQEGKIIKWFGTSTDIDDQKRAKEKLEELVADRTEELKRSNDDLQQFAHVASHDLKEPLRKMKTFGLRLKEEYSSCLPEKGKTYLEKIEVSATRMTQMIDSVLNYSVVNATEEPLEKVDLNLLIEGIESDLELLIIQKEAKIIYSGLPTVDAIPALIYQLFYNLINNSLKFARESTPSVINITAGICDEALVSKMPGLRAGIQYWDIKITDNGIGFHQDYAEKMFNVFARLNSREKYEGTGLGLALSRKIVHRHKGEIFAKGQEGRGAEFHVILPA